jgi:hypothetical protein
MYILFIEKKQVYNSKKEKNSNIFINAVSNIYFTLYNLYKVDSSMGDLGRSPTMGKKF